MQFTSDYTKEYTLHYVPLQWEMLQRICLGERVAKHPDGCYATCHKAAYPV